MHPQVRFIDVRACTCEYEVPYPESRERRTDASFSIGGKGGQLALMADGQVRGAACVLLGRMHVACPRLLLSLAAPWTCTCT